MIVIDLPNNILDNFSHIRPQDKLEGDAYYLHIMDAIGDEYKKVTRSGMKLSSRAEFEKAHFRKNIEREYLRTITIKYETFDVTCDVH